MAKEKRRMKTARGLWIYGLVLTLSLWFGAMALLTWAVAKDFQRQVADRTEDYTQYAFSHRRVKTLADNELPGAVEVRTIGSLGVPYHIIRAEQLLPMVLPHHPSSYGSDDWIYGRWDLLHGYELAASVEDETRDTHFSSGNYLTFIYTKKAQWAEGELSPLGYGYVDWEGVEGGIEAIREYGSAGSDGNIYMHWLFLPVIRMTGRFEGNGFVPAQIDRIRAGFIQQKSTFEMTLEEICRCDSAGLIGWDTLLDNGIAADMETIYVWDTAGTEVDLEPVTVDGIRYTDLREWLLQLPAGQKAEVSSNLRESICYGEITKTDEMGEYTYRLAVRCWPLSYAMARLIPMYVGSLVVVLLFLWLVMREVMKRLTTSLGQIQTAITYGTTVVPQEGTWQESYEMAAYLMESRQAMAEMKAQLQQTQTSLDYARNAEEYRKQLISNMAHELKTPLAVIHSYVESLQEDIVPEKRSHYLNVISQETERMDATILQMLDLSRLEAGKVKLTMSPFSLLHLVQTIAERMEPLRKQKQLSLTYTKAEEYLITADEGRISQVITNLLSNAIKYTEEGGQIRIQVAQHQHKAIFYIENTAPPLSKEALEKIWDSFYRVDTSRTDKGTGLGLTLVKQIVELHRGTCQVENVRYGSKELSENWVAFTISLPLDY